MGSQIAIAFISAFILVAQGARAEAPFIILQATTSTASSGLLEYLLPRFEESVEFQVRPVISGSGQALLNARRGDADVVLSHSEQAEREFVADGFGVSRLPIMYNRFVIVGPPDDPAEIAEMKSASEAFARIASIPFRFVSRGDDSGTHIKELSLWKSVGIDPQANSGTWYLETGAGQRTTLNVTTELKAYTLTDWATWIRHNRKSDFRVMSIDEPVLLNQYSAILVNPEKNPHVKYRNGQILVKWLTSPDGQKAISEFRIKGNRVFFPSNQLDVR